MSNELEKALNTIMQPDFGKKPRPDIRAIALAALNEMRQKGESYEMCARWISERVNAELNN